MLCFSLNENVHSNNTRHRNDPHIQPRNTHIMTNLSFLCEGPEIWFGLPNEIKQCKTRLSLNYHFKKHIVSQNVMGINYMYLEKAYTTFYFLDNIDFHQLSHHMCIYLYTLLHVLCSCISPNIG